MNKNEIFNLVDEEAKIYKKKEFNELQKFIDEPFRYNKILDGKKYIFEIRGKLVNDNLVSICIESRMRKLFSSYYARYFGKTIKGELVEGKGDLIF